MKKSKIVLLDEATSSIDVSTEKLVQDILVEMFKDCTMLVIAHRINTIANSDRILVMDNGIVGEFDKP